jgi:hypothetical protein
MKSVISIIISLNCIAVQLFLLWKISRKAKALEELREGIRKDIERRENLRSIERTEHVES